MIFIVDKEFKYLSRIVHLLIFVSARDILSFSFIDFIYVYTESIGY
jgi:hypothetical protein